MDNHGWKQMIKHYDNGEISTKIEYHFAGYGRNARAIYGKYITIYSIAKGIIIDRQYIAPNCFYR